MRETMVYPILLQCSKSVVGFKGCCEISRFVRNYPITLSVRRQEYPRVR